MVDFEIALDWTSIKMNGITVGICAISGQQVLYILGGVATITTIVYNAIRIVKELRSMKKADQQFEKPNL